MIENPVLRVSRPVAACSRCRTAKVKCDGKLPACTACEKSNRASECSSTNDQFARGKERSYVATLESRVDMLEKKIRETKARRKSSKAIMLDASEASTPPKSSVETVKPPRSISRRAARRKEMSEIDSLVSDFGLLAVNATARDFYGFSTEMSYARLLRSASTKKPLPDKLIKVLPPKSVANPLMQHYLNNIYTMLPIFEEATLYAALDKLYQQPDVSSPWEKWSVRMVFAIACISQSEQRGDAYYLDAVGYISSALENAEAVLHPGFISSIQALVLWTIYATMDPHHFDSWTLIGAASRAMVDLGMHQDPSKNMTMSKTKLDIRRRVYWCVYALDRATAVVQNRAFSFSDEAANVALPLYTTTPSFPKFSSPQSHLFQQSFDTALHLFRMRKIQSEWYMELFQSNNEPWSDPYPYIWKQYTRMSDWLNETPQSTPPSVRCFFELELLYSYVYLLAPNPRIPQIHVYAQRLIFEHGVSYATNLVSLLGKPSYTTNLPVTFYDALRACMTSRHFVTVLSRNMDVVLDPRPPILPSPLAISDECEDPLAPPTQISAPLFPSPVLPSDPIARAVDALNYFTFALSNFGIRFGITHWRDRFQRESASLTAQLYQRQSITPHASPPPQPNSAGPVTHQQWSPMSSSSPPQLQSRIIYQTLPTTPPFAYQRPSHFSASLNYNPFDHQSSVSPQRRGQIDPFESLMPNPQARPWAVQATSPGMPELPQPTDGQQRRTIVFGSGLPTATSPEPAMQNPPPAQDQNIVQAQMPHSAQDMNGQMWSHDMGSNSVRWSQ